MPTAIISPKSPLRTLSEVGTASRTRAIRNARRTASGTWARPTSAARAEMSLGAAPNAHLCTINCPSHANSGAAMARCLAPNSVVTAVWVSGDLPSDLSSRAWCSLSGGFHRRCRYVCHAQCPRLGRYGRHSAPELPLGQLSCGSTAVALSYLGRPGRVQDPDWLRGALEVARARAPAPRVNGAFGWVLISGRDGCAGRSSVRGRGRADLVADRRTDARWRRAVRG
jgi:hypothetical protein